MKYVHIVTNSSVMVLDTSNGESVTFFAGDPRYAKACDEIKKENFEAIFDLDTKNVVKKFFDIDENEAEYSNVSVSIEDGTGYVTLHDFNDMKVELHNAITNKVIEMYSQGFDAQPLINFIGNLYSNPSKTAIDELYLFVEAAGLPITEDGCFVAYKIVRKDYKDEYTGKMDNSVGEVVSMPRHLVDTDRSRTCSIGLHFCSKEYLPHYGNNGSRCMLVKVNPADVVSIPADYNNAKGRTWQYEVIGEVEGNWRAKLVDKDYADKAVVNNTGGEFINAPQPVKVPAFIAPVTYSDNFKRGYRDGYPEGKDKLLFVPRTDPFVLDSTAFEKEYNDGYDRGYKDGKNHKARLVAAF